MPYIFSQCSESIVMPVPTDDLPRLEAREPAERAYLPRRWTANATPPPPPEALVKKGVAFFSPLSMPLIFESPLLMRSLRASLVVWSFKSVRVRPRTPKLGEARMPSRDGRAGAIFAPFLSMPPVDEFFENIESCSRECFAASERLERVDHL